MKTCGTCKWWDKDDPSCELSKDQGFCPKASMDSVDESLPHMIAGGCCCGFYLKTHKDFGCVLHEER